MNVLTLKQRFRLQRVVVCGNLRYLQINHLSKFIMATRQMTFWPLELPSITVNSLQNWFPVVLIIIFVQKFILLVVRNLINGFRQISGQKSVRFSILNACCCFFMSSLFYIAAFVLLAIFSGKTNKEVTLLSSRRLEKGWNWCHDIVYTSTTLKLNMK